MLYIVLLYVNYLMLLKWKFLKLESHAASETQKAKSQ